jgi:hypothetical protein
MTQKQLSTLVGLAFLICVGIVLAFAVGDCVKGNVSNPIDKALKGQKNAPKN